LAVSLPEGIHDEVIVISCKLPKSGQHGRRVGDPTRETGSSLESGATRGWIRLKWSDNNFVKLVPDGRYIVVIKALKVLGNPNSPADYET
jgi:hypothetical protein